MKKFIAWTVALAATITLPAKDASAVINAEYAVSKKSEAPWAVRVWSVPTNSLYGEQPSAICTGVLISEYWVLTAAHCLFKMDNVNYLPGVTAPYSKNPARVDGHAFYHGGYNDAVLSNDIGLIRLFKPIKGASPRKLPPSNDRTLISNTMRVYGWGLDEYDSYGVLKTTRQSLDTVAGLFYPQFDPSSMISARWAAGGKWSGTCKGDSGGPLLSSPGNNRYVVGIVSFGIPNCDPRFASIYARVATHLSWIKSTQKTIDKTINRPGPPLELEASASGNSVYLRWSPPYVNGKYKVTKYKVEYTVDGGNRMNIVTDTTYANLIDLEYNRYYEFRVYAWNKSGWSLKPSNAVAVIPGRIKSDAPLGLSLTSSGNSIEASWQPPAYTGDSPVLEYEVRVGSDVFKTTSTSLIIPDRRQGVTHTVIVRAVTSAGLGAPAYSSIAIKIIPPPTEPTSVEVTLKGTSARVSWLPPKNTYGLSIIRYHLVKSDATGSKTYTTTDSFVDIDAVSPGSNVTFEVFAETSSGLGSKSSKSVFVPRLPDAPAVAAVTSTHDSIYVEWYFADKTDTLKASGFDVEYYTATGAKQSVTVSPELRSTTITGLKRGTSYSVQVSALTAWSKTRSVLRSISTLPVPHAVVNAHTAVRENGSVLLSWSTTSEDSVSRHMLQTSASASDLVSGPIVFVDGPQLSLRIEEDRGMYYRIRAENAAGWGDWSSVGSFPARLSLAYQKTFFEKSDNGVIVMPVVAGGSGQKKYSISGVLPHGMSFNTTNGALTAPSQWAYDTAHIESGKEHACAVTGSGRLVCWGANASGQLGTGDFVQKSIPSLVPALSDVVEVSAGTSHTCALTSGKEVYCWGSNTDGQLGNGSNTSSASPVKVEGSYVSVSLGEKHTCAIDVSGVAYCWGLNTNGQLGNGTIKSRNTPHPVSSLSGVTKISSGYYHTCATTSGESLYCWGYNASGQLGVGSGSQKTSPVKVGSISGVTAVSAGENSTCARSISGLYCWGSNQYGQVGVGASLGMYSYPQKVTIGSVEKLNVAERHVCATLSGGSLYCWGYDWSSSLVKNTPTPYFSVVAAQISTGSNFSCVVDSFSEVSCWGKNGSGQLGKGDTVSSSSPAASKTPAKGFPADVQVTVSDDSGYHTISVTLTNH